MKIFDYDTAIHRDAVFTLRADAQECCQVIKYLITASNFHTATVEGASMHAINNAAEK